MSGIDDLFKQIEADELADYADTVTKLTPIEYARLRGIAPQLVYYRLRNRALKWHRCNCGRKVIDIAEADAVFKFKEGEKRGKEDAWQEQSADEEGFDEDD